MDQCDNLQAPDSKLLKKDAFGVTERLSTAAGCVVRRNADAAASGLRWLARILLAAEARALVVLDHLEGVPKLMGKGDGMLERQYIAGVPMQVARPVDATYFFVAARLLRRIHRAGIAHNDLAKEPNFLVTDAGMPAIIDFQLAYYSPRRSALFRHLAREDIRHLLKHKRTYRPQSLTRRERQILATPSWMAATWMATGKPVYLFITRRLLGWQDREGAGDRV